MNEMIEELVLPARGVARHGDRHERVGLPRHALDGLTLDGGRLPRRGTALS